MLTKSQNDHAVRLGLPIFSLLLALVLSSCGGGDAPAPLPSDSDSSTIGATSPSPTSPSDTIAPTARTASTPSETREDQLTTTATTSPDKPDVTTELPKATPSSDPTEAPSLMVGPEIGKLAPEFELTTVEGDVLALSDFLGNRPFILYFFATWVTALPRRVADAA